MMQKQKSYKCLPQAFNQHLKPSMLKQSIEEKVPELADCGVPLPSIDTLLAMNVEGLLKQDRANEVQHCELESTGLHPQTSK